MDIVAEAGVVAVLRRQAHPEVAKMRDRRVVAVPAMSLGIGRGKKVVVVRLDCGKPVDGGPRIAMRNAVENIPSFVGVPTVDQQVTAVFQFLAGSQGENRLGRPTAAAIGILMCCKSPRSIRPGHQAHPMLDARMVNIHKRHEETCQGLAHGRVAGLRLQVVGNKIFVAEAPLGFLMRGTGDFAHDIETDARRQRQMEVLLRPVGGRLNRRCTADNNRLRLRRSIFQSQHRLKQIPAIVRTAVAEFMSQFDAEWPVLAAGTLRVEPGRLARCFGGQPTEGHKQTRLVRDGQRPLVTGRRQVEFRGGVLPPLDLPSAKW